MEQGDQAQHPEPSEAAHRDTAKHIVPVHKGVEEPAVVGFAINGYNPTHPEFREVYGDKNQINSDKIIVYIMQIHIMKMRQVARQNALHNSCGKKPIEQD